MIVRINQFAAAQSEEQSGWGAGARSGPIRYDWPTEAFAYEVLVLDTDEQQQPLTRGFRQARLRELIPEVLLALRDPTDQLVLRVDGELTPGGLLGCFQYLSPEHGVQRFGISESLELRDHSSPAEGSIRMQVDDAHLALLCGEHAIGGRAALRLRAFAVPGELVPPLLDISDLDDERWGEVLEETRFIVQTVRDHESLQILTRKITPEAVRDRLTDRLSRRT